jgi:hypothetical protein
MFHDNPALTAAEQHSVQSVLAHLASERQRLALTGDADGETSAVWEDCTAVIRRHLVAGGEGPQLKPHPGRLPRRLFTALRAAH